MTEIFDRRGEERSDLRRIYDKIDEVGNAVSRVDTTLQVHIAKYEVTEDAVKDHGEKWKEIEKLKTKGLLYLVLGLLASGAAGGGVAHIARKFIE